MPRAAHAPREVSSDDIERQARELEDLLTTANDRSARRPTAPSKPLPPTQPSRQPAEACAAQGGWGQETQVNRRVETPLDDAEARQSEQAMILLRAMVNAAKCDGQVSQAEQQSILGRLENPSPSAIQFLRDEFSKPLDVREFAWSVPVGMEQQVYSMSLIAIDVDSDREHAYLSELAHGLRLSRETCEQLKERIVGAGVRLAPARQLARFSFGTHGRKLAQFNRNWANVRWFLCDRLGNSCQLKVAAVYSA